MQGDVTRGTHSLPLEMQLHSRGFLCLSLTLGPGRAAFVWSMHRCRQSTCTCAQSSPVPWQLVGCVCPHRGAATNTCALARGTNQSSWPETSREITSTRAGKNSECSWVHACILSENKMCWANVSEKWGILHKAISKCPKLKCKLRVQGQNWCPGSKFPIQTIVLTKVTKNAKLLWI